MFQAWTWPAEVGILVGFLAFIVMFVPILVWESRRVGRIGFWRLVGAAMVSIYAVALFAYTLLPLPSDEWCAANSTPVRNLVPLNFVRPVLHLYRTQGAGALLTSFVSLQVAMNVVLFVPWGALWRRYFGSGVVFATLSGLVMSVLIESAQTTGFFGAFPCGNRTGDVDDVITNTLGSLIGALVAPLIFFFLPEPHAVMRSRRAPRPVTRARRLVALAVDALALTGVYVMVMVAFRAQQVYVFREPNSPTLLSWESFWAWAAAVGFIAVLPQLLRGGATFGQRALWLEPRYPGGAGGRLTAWCCGFGGWAVLVSLAHLPLLGSSAGQLASLAMAGAVVSVVVLVFDRTAAGLAIRLAHGQVADARQPAAGHEVERTA